MPRARADGRAHAQRITDACGMPRPHLVEQRVPQLCAHCLQPHAVVDAMGAREAVFLEELELGVWLCRWRHEEEQQPGTMVRLCHESAVVFCMHTAAAEDATASWTYGSQPRCMHGWRCLSTHIVVCARKHTHAQQRRATPCHNALHTAPFRASSGRGVVLRHLLLCSRWCRHLRRHGHCGCGAQTLCPLRCCRRP